MSEDSAGASKVAQRTSMMMVAAIGFEGSRSGGTDFGKTASHKTRFIIGAVYPECKKRSYCWQ